MLRFVSAEPKLPRGISLHGFFLELPASPLGDAQTTVLGFARAGILCPPSGVDILALDALLDWSPLRL